jgi:hypothetical protein
MYLRYTTRKKDGKTRRYCRLVQSVRVGRIKLAELSNGLLNHASRICCSSMTCKSTKTVWIAASMSCSNTRMHSKHICPSAMENCSPSRTRCCCMEVKLLDGTVPEERFILCRSADRREKERAMHEKFSTGIEQALARLQGRIAQAKKPLDKAPSAASNRPSAAT